MAVSKLQNSTLSNGSSQGKDRRAQNEEAIPDAWRLDPTLLQGLKMPLETSKNNLQALDLPRRSGILTSRELEITESYGVQQLLDGLANGQLTSVEVTTAFCKRAAIAHQATNCLTEIFFDRALERARTLDSQREQGKIAGPLHGLPISLKECFQVAGVPATLGLLAYSKHQSTANSALVDVLNDLGAVFYCKTNVPQTMMSSDSHNWVFGRTLNPWNTSLTAGGSSGGEGALVAMRGSPIGVGTDIAGSIRIPALCCGTYGFRPTADRVPYGGMQSCSTPGLKALAACAGPLANSMEALEAFMKAVVNSRPAKYDPRVIDVPWRGVSVTSSTSRFRFGVMPEDPVFPIHPPIKRAIAAAVKRIETQGHEIVYLKAEECHVAEATMTAWALMGLDDRADHIVQDGGEAVVPSRVRILEEKDKIDWSYLSDVDAQPGLARLAGLNVKRAELIDSWRQLWSRHQLDAVIGPAAQNTAIEHDEYGMPPYTQFLNLIDYPACVIPFGEASQSTEDGPFEIKAGQSAPKYDASNLDGAPCSVQVFTQRMRDEECMEFAKIVDACLH